MADGGIQGKNNGRAGYQAIHPEIQPAQKELGNKLWPEFMQHDPIVEEYWPKLYSLFSDYQFALSSGNDIVGIGNTIPVHYTDELSNLPPQGLDWAMEKAVKENERKLVPNLLVAVQILIGTDLRGKGLSYELLNSMKLVARKQGIKLLALPVRPTCKHQYPLVPMEEYIKWTNDNGEAFDPWIRVHTIPGGNIISVCSESMQIRGTIVEWEEWTGLSFQSSGLYTIDKALCPVQIDLANYKGEYIEPNVWIIHTS